LKERARRLQHPFPSMWLNRVRGRNAQPGSANCILFSTAATSWSSRTSRRPDLTTQDPCAIYRAWGTGCGNRLHPLRPCRRGGGADPGRYRKQGLPVPRQQPLPAVGIARSACSWPKYPARPGNRQRRQQPGAVPVAGNAAAAEITRKSMQHRSLPWPPSAVPWPGLAEQYGSLAPGRSGRMLAVPVGKIAKPCAAVRPADQCNQYLQPTWVND